MAKKETMLRLDVRIERPVFVAKDSDYAVYEVALLNPQDVTGEQNFFGGDTFVKIVGNFDKRYHFGEEFIMFGIEHQNTKFKETQYKVQMVQNKFDTPDRVKGFLLQFCAKSIVDQLLNKYGNDILDKILNNEVDYSDIHGMGDIRFGQLQEKVKENAYMKDVIVSLSEFGITPNQMKKIVKEFGASAVTKIQDNPYVLCKIHGIGFIKADEVAKRMGYDMESPFRIQEAIKYTIAEMQKDGHSWLKRKDMLTRCGELLNLKMKTINEQVEETHGVYYDDNRVSLERTYMQEAYIAETLMDILKDEKPLNIDMDAFLVEMQEKYQVKLTEQQKSLFYFFIKYRICFLVGYAGCGKSFLQKIMIDLLERMNLSYSLLAPTGKASKVLEQYTGRNASTIHRALKIGADDLEPAHLDDEVIIVDESSMAGIPIVYALMRAIDKKNVRLLFIGDDFQIPSVDVGNFLHDCVESRKFPVAKLTQVFRQAEGGVLDIATKYREKDKFIDSNFAGKEHYGKDLTIWSVKQERIEAGYLYVYKEALKQFEQDEIIILSPTKKGNLGTVTINKMIQEIANPDVGQKQMKYGLDTIYRVGDRIFNQKNNYKAITMHDGETTIYNGDIGVIQDIDFDKQHVIIDYGFAVIKTPFNTLDTISHAWAWTIHKSQGSGFKKVIIIADKAHKWQLNANLVYTGITRTQVDADILCQADVLNSAMKKNISLTRNTFLPDFL